MRDFLLVQTAHTADLADAHDKARRIAATMAEELGGAEHPYLRLLGNEFRFVTENDASHTAHEYLADYNYSYSRREFFDLWRDMISGTSPTPISTTSQAASPTN